MSYQQQYKASIDQPEQFWAEQASKIHWFRQPRAILSRDENGVDRWFADGELNTAY
ncbi:MAG: acetyl-coenzyme A synthetase N-terminal domain-containing protein, partial [Pseudomonadota bacterium]